MVEKLRKVQLKEKHRNNVLHAIAHNYKYVAIATPYSQQINLNIVKININKLLFFCRRYTIFRPK